MVYNELRALGHDVFLDRKSMKSGDFEARIRHEISARDYFVIILQEGSLDRIGTPGDWLRREIQEAIRTGRTIVPLLFDEFRFDACPPLPDDIQVLRKQNGVRVPGDFLEHAVKDLSEDFLTVRPARDEPRPAETQELPAVARLVTKVASEPIPRRRTSVEARTGTRTSGSSVPRSWPARAPGSTPRRSPRLGAQLGGTFVFVVGLGAFALLVWGAAAVRDSSFVTEIFRFDHSGRSPNWIGRMFWIGIPLLAVGAVPCVICGAGAHFVAGPAGRDWGEWAAGTVFAGWLIILIAMLAP